MRIVIIGGVAGGATAATRLRRLSEKDEIVIYEKDKHIAYANCGLPYYLGGVIKDRMALSVQSPLGLKSRFNIDVKISHEVIEIDTKEKRSKLKI
ncbi:MAG TPA: FAD-dependent oxidoreductase [Clostridiales bacterium]|nr:FAD-dependent oxidoreductase [Clostridiales bacterium]